MKIPAPPAPSPSTLQHSVRQKSGSCRRCARREDNTGSGVGGESARDGTSFSTSPQAWLRPRVVLPRRAWIVRLPSRTRTRALAAHLPQCRPVPVPTGHASAPANSPPAAGTRPSHAPAARPAPACTSQGSTSKTTGGYCNGRCPNATSYITRADGEKCFDGTGLVSSGSPLNTNECEGTGTTTPPPTAWTYFQGRVIVGSP